MKHVVGIGTDLEPVDSFRKKPFEKNPRFYARIFSPGEIKYCLKFKDPYPRFAARFCAKEAMVKAVDEIRKSYITEFEVEKTPSGRPTIVARKKSRSLASFFLNYCCKLSISHTDHMALAFVVVTEKHRT